MFILPDKTSACCDGSYIGEGMFTRPDKHPACDVTGDCWVYFGDASLPHLIVDARGDPWLYWGTGDALGPTNVPTPGRTDDRTDAEPSRAGLSSRERFLGGGGWLISTFLMGLGERAGFEAEGIELEASPAHLDRLRQSEAREPGSQIPPSHPTRRQQK